MNSLSFNFKSLILGLVALTAAHCTLASPTTDALLDKLKRTYPNIAFDRVNETPAAGIFEAVFGTDLLYFESSGTYFFPTMVNMLTKTNLGDDRRDELNKINFSELPLKDAIKVVHGDGSRKMVVFADPNCGYCKKLEINLESVKNVTIYTFVLGILAPDSTTKANSINAATGDKAKLWHALMKEGARLVEKTGGVGAATTDRNLALFKKYNFQGTPAIIFQNGMTLKGYAEVSRIEELLAKK